MGPPQWKRIGGRKWCLFVHKRELWERVKYRAVTPRRGDPPWGATIHDGATRRQRASTVKANPFPQADTAANSRAAARGFTRQCRNRLSEAPEVHRTE